MNTKRNTCKSCAFCKDGECRRYPKAPVSGHTPSGIMLTEWRYPEVDVETDSCGEHIYMTASEKRIHGVV